LRCDSSGEVWGKDKRDLELKKAGRVGEAGGYNFFGTPPGYFYQLQEEYKERNGAIPVSGDERKMSDMAEGKRLNRSTKDPRTRRPLYATMQLLPSFRF
jgi:hypothetical protein